jgi:pimeloyl-ACP methyl ester carboxylesterase
MATRHEVIEKRIGSGKYASHTLLAGDPKSPALVLLHGAGPGAHAASNWHKIMPDLAENFYVIAPDLIGFGKSDYPDPFPESIMGWIGLRVDQIIGLMDTLKIDKAHVVGNSMGGALTLQLLSESPERFAQVVLMGSIGAPGPRTPELVRLLSFYFDPRPSRYREVIYSFAYDPENFTGIEHIIEDRYKLTMDPEIQRVSHAMFDAMKVGIETLNMPPSLLAKMPHEVLIFHGRQDRVVPLDTSLSLLQNLKNCELVVLDRCGHWAQLQRWDLMRPLMERHFGVKSRQTSL